MAIELNELHGGKVLVVRVSQKLSKEDYEQFTPEIERLVGRFGKLRILFEMHNFEGWDAGALWEDVKFDAKHFNDIERLAFVGDKKWEKGMATFCRAFTTAEIKYFDWHDVDEAQAWIEEGVKETV